METSPASRQLRELPPRYVNIFTKATILFGGFFQQFGWIFFTFGSLFCWIFIPESTVKFWFEFGKEWNEIPGKVVASEPTNSSVNEEVVYSYLHSYEVDGQSYTGKSFTTGQDFQNGQEVTVLVNANNPAEAYIKGSKRAVFPGIVLVVLIFPLIGLGFIIYSLRSNLKAIKLLKIGDFTRGILISKDRTNTTVKINNATYPVYKYSFEFKSGGRTHVSICKTHQIWLVEDEEREIILYDQFNPEYNLVYDAAPNMPSINEQGMFEPVSLKKLLYLILPLLGIAMNVYFFLNNPFSNLQK